MRTVFGVLSGTKIEKRADTDAVEMRDLFEQIIAVFDRFNPFKLIIQRPGAHCLDRFLIHTARVVVAYLLRFGREPWIDMCAFRFLRNVMQRIVVVLDQLVETAPARIFRRNLGLFDPSAIGVDEEILLWFYRQIPVARVQRGPIFFNRRFYGFTAGLMGIARDRRRRFLRVRCCRSASKRLWLWRFSLCAQNARSKERDGDHDK